MKRFIKKLNTILVLSAVAAGIVFCFCGFSVFVPKGVTVYGCEVGGMSRPAAVACVRGKIEDELKKEKLIIKGKKEEYEFSFPEIGYKDDVVSVVKNAKRNGNYSVRIGYYLCGLNEIAAAICSNERINKQEPYAEFQKVGAPFVYREGNDGREVDIAKLKNDILNSLKGGFEAVDIKYFEVKRQNSVENVRKNTTLLGNFSTVFDLSNTNRASNISLAAGLLNGVVLQSGETLSFNDTVGARLPERGFLPAKIIENGEYTEGVGGGVCQVSTTLYNAALLSGMTVTEFHPHSLPVGYVAPSRDAMVSGKSCDLKFKNPTKFPIYIRSSAKGGVLNFKIYGKSDGASYSLESVVLESVPAPEEFCSDPALARNGKDGVLSEGYIVINRGGYIKRVKLRRDKYLPQKRVIFSGTTDLEQPDEEQNSIEERI